MKWIKRWKVRSHTHYDKEYTVSLADDETWGVEHGFIIP
jgi:hypothetical protein